MLGVELVIATLTFSTPHCVPPSQDAEIKSRSKPAIELQYDRCIKLPK
jgi:hypothetical protein